VQKEIHRLPFGMFDLPYGAHRTMEKIRKFRWQEWLLILGFGLSLVVIILFSIRTVRYFPHRRVDEPIRPWMSLPYIAHSYRVPAYILYQALGLPLQPRDRRPIAVIARNQNRSLASVIAALQAAITHARPPYATPPPSPPEPTRSTV
jgi:hypothetical protein